MHPHPAPTSSPSPLPQFLNSAISTIIANASLPGLASLLKNTKVNQLFFQGVYSDLTPNWYKVRGGWVCWGGGGGGLAGDRGHKGPGVWRRGVELWN